MEILEALSNLGSLNFFGLWFDLIIVLQNVSSGLPYGEGASGILTWAIPLLLFAICGFEGFHLRRSLDDFDLSGSQLLFVVKTLVYDIVRANIIAIEKDVGVIYSVIVQLPRLVLIHLVALIYFGNIAGVDVTVLLLVDQIGND